jgi:hypothetical protein
MGDRVAGFEGRDDAFGAGKQLGSLRGIRHRSRRRTRDDPCHGSRRAPVRPRHNRGRRRRNACLRSALHQDVGHAALQHAETAAGERSAACSPAGDAAAAGFDADQTHAGFVEELEEGADRVGTAADAGDDGVRETAFGVEDLLLGSSA